MDKLWQRQLLICCPARSYHRTRSLYQCIVPNHTEQGVQPPSGFLRKFSPDGRNLLAFSNDQRNVLVYEYRGASAAQSLYLKDYSEDDIKMQLFDRFFRLRFSIPVAQNVATESAFSSQKTGSTPLSSRLTRSPIVQTCWKLFETTNLSSLSRFSKTTRSIWWTLLVE